MQNFFLNRELVYRNPLARALGLMNKRRMYRETAEHLKALGLAGRGAPSGVGALGRPAADDRGRPRDHLGPAHRHARRARGGARRAAVDAGARSSCARWPSAAWPCSSSATTCSTSSRRPTGSSCSATGRRSATCATAEATAQQIVTLITGSELDGRRPGLRGLMRAAADVGGTFTDVLLQLPSGEIAYRKVLSSPPAYDVAVVDGVARAARRRRGGRLEEVVHGTTVATNAVLERRGARTALVTTKGFRDVLELRRVRMPHLYDLFWSKPPPLVERSLRLELDERMSADGEVLRRSTTTRFARVARAAARARASSRSPSACCTRTAIPEHERRVGRDPARGAAGPAGLALERDPARAAGVRAQRDDGRQRLRAAADGALHRRHPRAASTTRGIDAPLTIMQSSGGVMTADDAAARPGLRARVGAGGRRRRGARRSRGARASTNVIAFDMGGTTAKASLDRGRPRLAQPRVRGRRVALGRQPAAARQRRADPDPDDRHRRGRRGRRQRRLARRGRRAARRAAQRGRRPGAGLLRPRRRRSRP